MEKYINEEMCFVELVGSTAVRLQQGAYVYTLEEWLHIAITCRHVGV